MTLRVSTRMVVPLAVSLAALLSPSARADDSPAVVALRARLSAVQHSPSVPAGAIVSTQFLLDVATRNAESFGEQSQAWQRIATRYVGALEAGHDPYMAETNKITNRGYTSRISQTRQGYAVYLPPNYDPNRRYPLLIALHGGSSNGNLFLGVVLGNNMDWLTYDQHLWDVYEPRWSPDWIIVAPDGFGQVLWRWMGEEDILSVLEDVQQHYSVDNNRVVLSGLSNGGVGAYSVGMRQAWRFSLVTAMAGAPSWLQYAGGRPSATDRALMMPLSGLHLIQNSVNTDFRFYHGRLDHGPMRPAYVTELEAAMRGLGLVPNVTWFDMGHDLLYVVHRHGRAYDNWAQIIRNQHPADVRVTTGDYRAARQHWVTLSRIENYPQLCNLRAQASGDRVLVTTDNALEFSLALGDVPLISDDAVVRVQINGQPALEVRAGTVAVFSRANLNAPFVAGALAPAPALEKRPGVSGPLPDAYRDTCIHVYGTQVASDTDALRRSAQRGARGWPLWLWNFNQQVVADTAVTPAMIANAHLVLYGTPGSNALLEQLAPQLPIRLRSDGLRIGETLYSQAHAGTRFIYPNPRNPNRYVVVQAGRTLQAVDRGHNLPDFVADFVVYDGASLAQRERLVAPRRGYLATGFFDRFWQLQTPPEPPVRQQPTRPAPLRQPTAIQPTARRPQPATPPAATQHKSLKLAKQGETAHPVSAEAQRAQELRESLERGEIARILGTRANYHLPPLVRQQEPPYAMPMTPPPSNPDRPSTSDFVAPVTDLAGRIARQIAANIPSFLNFRAIIPGATWEHDEAAILRIRSTSTCLAALRATDANFQSLSPQELATVVGPTPHDPLVPVPVRIHSVGGVAFTSRVPIVVSCEFAMRLVAFASILRSHHVASVQVASSVRVRPAQSFHTMGMAVDLSRFVRDDGSVLNVRNEFVETPAAFTCQAQTPSEEHARELLAIACETAHTHIFNSVLTPNYNEGHRDHFHIDIRPDDPRFYIR